MDRNSKTMIIATVFLLFTLIIKSTILDPVGVQTGDLEKYRLYAAQTAPLSGGLLEKTGLLTYRVIRVKRDSIDGNTEILLKTDDGENWKNEKLDGQYSGKVRGYLFYFIPVKEINLKGGVMKDGK